MTLADDKAQHALLSDALTCIVEMCSIAHRYLDLGDLDQVQHWMGRIAKTQRQVSKLLAARVIIAQLIAEQAAEDVDR